MSGVGTSSTEDGSVSQTLRVYITKQLLDLGEISEAGGKATIASMWIGMLTAIVTLWFYNGPERFWYSLVVTLIFLASTYLGTWAISRLWN